MRYVLAFYYFFFLRTLLTICRQIFNFLEVKYVRISYRILYYSNGFHFLHQTNRIVFFSVPLYFRHYIIYIQKTYFNTIIIHYYRYWLQSDKTWTKLKFDTPKKLQHSLQIYFVKYRITMYWYGNRRTHGVFLTEIPIYYRLVVS